MMHKKVGGLTHKGEAGGALIALALGLALAGVGLAGCGEDPATADDVAKAVAQKEKDDKAALNADRATLQGAVAAALAPSEMRAFGAVEISGSVGGNITVTRHDMEADFSLEQTITLSDPETYEQTASYTVELKAKDATKGKVTIDPYDSSKYKAEFVGDTTTEAGFDYQIINTMKRSDKYAGVITLKLATKPELILSLMEMDFEDAIKSLKANSTKLTGQWQNPAFTGAYGQTDAKFTANLSKDGLSSTGTIALPSVATWANPTANTANFTATLSGEAENQKLGWAIKLKAGSVTVPFTLKNPKQPTQTVGGTLVITVTN